MYRIICYFYLETNDTPVCNRYVRTLVTLFVLAKFKDAHPTHSRFDEPWSNDCVSLFFINIKRNRDWRVHRETLGLANPREILIISPRDILRSSRRDL